MKKHNKMYCFKTPFQSNCSFKSGINPAELIAENENILFSGMRVFTII